MAHPKHKHIHRWVRETNAAALRDEWVKLIRARMIKMRYERNTKSKSKARSWLPFFGR